ncbi:hypothetical protein V8C37DRAFT_395499 [Trichoderma ceciliae]
MDPVIAKQTEIPSPPAAAEAKVIAFKKRGGKATANIRKRPGTLLSANETRSSDDTNSSSDSETGQKVKRRRTKATVTASSRDRPSATKEVFATVASADRNAPLFSTDDATKQAPSYDGPNDPNKTLRSYGPVRAPTNIRTVTMLDFQADICKDYKKTGSCGFGDNCKFTHIREDYKQGWELDKEWEKVTEGRALKGTVVGGFEHKEASDDDETNGHVKESMPSNCTICGRPYENPVVTHCGHYFCERCALRRYKHNPTCAICNTKINGTFRAADKLKSGIKNQSSTDRDISK